MSLEKHFREPKEMSSMLKTMFRNQSVFVWRTAKQTDLKANMLISLGFYVLLGLAVIRAQFDTYMHFSPYLLLIPWLLALLCVIECIYVVAPNTRFFRKLFSKELLPEYPEKEFHNMYSHFPLNIMDREASIDAMLDDHALQLGNIIRGHYISSKYINNKYKHLDRAYNYFLATITAGFSLFLLNTILSGGHFHEHIERSSYTSFTFESPSSINILDEKLKEISGITYSMEEQVLYAINDEKGRIYKLNPENGKIIVDYKFSGKGDYEGIELCNNKILVTNSAGDIYISNPGDQKAIIQHTPLSKINDVEGMGFDAKLDRILLACKGDPWLPIDGDKGIFSYNQHFHRMDSTVYLDIKISDLKSCVDTIYEDQLMIQSLHRRLIEFAPSAIAIDPINQDVYVLTAHGSILVIYDHMKVIRDVIHLNEVVVPQPEGICFDKDNNLFISTEGHGGSGKLFKFDRNISK